MKFELRMIKDNVLAQIISLSIAFVILAVPSKIPSQFISTIIGKIISIVIIYLAAVFISPIVSALFAIVFIVLLSETKEGLSNNLTTTQNIENSTISKFKNKHCKQVDGKTIFVDSDGKTVSLKDMKDMFPNVLFNSSLCDPCDNNCDYTVIERMTIEEELRHKKEGRGVAVTRAERANLSI